MAEYGRAPGGFVTHPVTPPPYDSDALAYFTAFETAGGSFDQTGIDPTYTESYLKTSIDNFVAGCKTDGVWDKMTEAYLMAGGTFAGLTTKLKGRDANGVEYQSDFSAGIDGWGASSGTRAGNIDGIGSQDDNLRFTIDGTSGQHGLNKSQLTSGATYIISFDVYIPSSNTDIDGFYISARNGSSAITTPTPDTWVSASYASQVPNSTGVWYIYAAQGSNSSFTGNGTDVFYIRNVTVTETKAPSLTNNNFVTGDYLGVGTGAGLTGDGSTKYLDTGLNDNTLSADDRGYSVYVTKALTVASYMMLNYPGSGSAYSGFGSFDGVTTQFFLPASDASLNSPAGDGMLIGSRRGVNDTEGYRNGVSVATDTSTASNTTTGVTFDLFANGIGANRTDATLTFAHIGTGLTDTDASNLSTRVNTLMTALGCNTY